MEVFLRKVPRKRKGMDAYSRYDLHGITLDLDMCEPVAMKSAEKVTGEEGR